MVARKPPAFTAGKDHQRPQPVTAPPLTPKPADVLLIDRSASVQFGQPFHFRVTRVYDWTTYHGWVWLGGYQLDEKGNAVAKRDIFVQKTGLKHAPPTPTTQRAAKRGAR